MMVSIGGYSMRGATLASPQQQIARLQAQLKTLQKSMQQVTKQMAESADPNLQKVLMAQMQQIQMMMDAIKAQIIQIQANEDAQSAARERNKRLHDEALGRQ